MGIGGDLWHAYKKYTPTGMLVDALTGTTPTAAPPPGIVTNKIPDDPSKLQANPDGTVTDVTTGQTYTQTPDGYGGTQLAPVVNPNVAQQVGANLTKAAGFYGQVPGYDAREGAAFAREGALADDLNATAHGVGPSVAGTQLQIGLGQAANQQLAQAAGASGNNAALGRTTAMNNTAQLQAQTNQSAALARAAEAAAAQKALAAVTGSMADQSRGMGAIKTNTGLDLSKLALEGEAGHEGLTIKTEEDKAEADKEHRDRIFSGAGQVVSYASGGGGKKA